MLVGVASLGRLWCSVYIAGRKSRELVQIGPYSLCRNPLYFFSFAGALGVGLATETLLVPAVIAVAFAVAYSFVIRREEAKLSALHGTDYEAYRARTPRFWPKPRLLTEPVSYAVDPRRLRIDLFHALWFVWLVGLVEMLEELREYEVLPNLLHLP